MAVAKEKGIDVTTEKGLDSTLVDDVDDFHKVHSSTARDGAATEQHLSVKDAFSYYRKAVFWSITISMVTIMESYDTQLVNSFYALPAFAAKYGKQLPDGSYTVEAGWQIGLSMSLLVGMILGCYLNGWFFDYFGPKRVLIGGLSAMTGFIFIQFFAPTVEVLFAGNLLCAVPWGMFAAATPAYAADVAPMVLRPYLVTYVNLCWVMGHLIATGVLTPLANSTTQWGYRIPLAIQWVWPPFLIVAILFAPESPWWLVKKGRPEEAEAQLHRLLTSEAVASNAVNPREIVALMEHTIATERNMNIGSSYADLFKGSNLRRTEIAVVSWGGQILPGFAIQNYTTYFFVLAGLSPVDSFKLSLGTFSIAFVGTCLSWLALTHYGRRTIYLTGLCCMIPFMWTIGFIDLAPASDTSNYRWAQSALLLVWFFIYGVSIGPVPYAIAADVGASNLRTKTISLGRNSYYFLSVINTVCAPYMLNAEEGNLKGKAAFPAAGCTIALLVWGYFRLPETKGLLPETLDFLFEKKVPARKFLAESRQFQ